VISLALLSGLLTVGGGLLAASGLARAPAPPARARRRSLQVPTPARVATIGGAALLVLLVTRWPVAAAAGGVGAALLGGSRAALGRQPQHADTAEALAAWAEMLPRGIEGVLVATAASAPPLVREPVRRAARRLPFEALDPVLDDLAGDLAHPVGDLVVTALRLAARSGGRQVRTVLDDLATAAREQAQMHRRVEVARARPRSDMRSVLAIMGGFLVLFSVGARGYLEPYGTVLGQLVLVMVVLIWAAALWGMARMGRDRPLERFLARAGR
jgi:hypothetical protein